MQTGSNRLLVVGSNPKNLQLLEDFISQLGYSAVSAQSLPALDRTLEQHGSCLRFALVDITGYDHEIWERCSRINQQDIPVLVISPQQSAEVARLSIEHGAKSVMTKPLVMRELAETIQGFLKLENPPAR